MTVRRDVPLQLSEPQAHSDSAWSVGQEPTDLIAMWPAGAGQAAPTLEQVLKLFDKNLGYRPAVVEDQPLRRESEIIWSAAIQLTNGPTALLWAEPMREMSADNIEHLKARGVQWVIGAQAMLNPADSFSDFVLLLKMLAQGIPDSPAILNVNTEGWYARADLNDDIFGHGIDPRMSVMWIVHGVSDGTDDNAGAWLYTRGLNRCGLPELEMLNVPIRRARSTGAFLNSLAELVYERGLPAPGDPFEIGADLDVAFQPWELVAASIPGEVRGSSSKRISHDEQTLNGVRAAVCAVEPVNGRWVWPEEIIDRLEGEEPAALYQTAHETECRTRRARITWDDLCRAFAALGNPSAPTTSHDEQPYCHVKAGFERPGLDIAGSPPDREHLWFEVLRFDGQRVQGRLLNQPMIVPGLRRGDVRWIERVRLSDWRIVIPQMRNSFGPEHVRHLRQAIFALKSPRP